MSTHKLTAGDGYLYLIRQTAAHDADKRGRASLGDYYTEKGETPGRWVGRGLSAFGDPAGRELLSDYERELWRIEPGSEVTEAHMLALFGLGVHPNAGRIAEHLILRGAGKAAATAAVNLGRPFLINDASTELQRRLAVAFRDHNLSQSLPWNHPIDDARRAQMRTSIARDMFAETYDRPPSDDRELTGFIATQSRDQTTSTAGYDLTFSPVKSFSVLWALGDLELSKTLEQCHESAVADTLDFLQDQAAFTRMGAHGVAQLDTEGFIAAQFTHRDSRAGDPDLHTHVAVSNKVRAVAADGIPRWLALDGRPLFKTTVAASEFYNTRLEAYASELAGLVFEDRPSLERGKRPVREIVGIPTDLCEMFSTRRTLIRDRYTTLAKTFQSDHGREPTTIEALALYQRATLETRVAKHEPRSLAEQRQQWRTQAIEHLGDQRTVSAMLVGARAHLPRPVTNVTEEWVAEQARAVIDTVAGTRSSWQRVHVYAEAQRRVRAAGLATDRTLAETITAAALAEPLSRAHARVRDADLGEPDVLRRRDGSSVYTTHGTELFTSAAVLAAENRILHAAGQRDGRRVDDDAVDMALLQLKATRGRTLNPGQHAVVREMATSGRRVQLALAPAGSGKTTAMAALARAWEESGGHVLGLSPGANQAQLLRDDIHTDTDTVDKFIWLRDHPDATTDPARSWFDAIDDRTLIILDEAGKAGTLQLDAVITTALARGASVRLIGDDQQLASVSAGGVLRDIDATHGTLTLTEVVRFTSRAEAQAGLAIRNGDPAGLAFYADHGRIHVGSDDTVIDTVYHHWAADRNRGRDTAMLAPTNAVVTQLNERARLDRLDRLVAQGNAIHAEDLREAQLSDGLRASIGDTVATRRNQRTLRLGGGGDFVRNGYRWRVQNVTRDGGLTVARLDTGQKAVLPAWYVKAHVTLGYAATIDASQGMTIGSKTVTGTCHVVGSDRLTRQQLYTAMTRATDASHVYLATAETDAHKVLTPKATHPDTALDILQRVLARDGSQVSATTEQRTADDPFQRLGQATRMYVHALGALAEHRLGPTAMTAIDTAADEIHPKLTDAGGWPTLRLHLALLAITGADPVERLRTAATAGDLTNVADPAAVLDYRLGGDTRAAGPLRWLPAIPDTLVDTPDWADYLQARHQLVTELAERIRHTAAGWDTTTAPRWARPLLDANTGVRAEIAVFRAAHDVPEPDTRLTGPDQYATRDRRAQQLLEQMATREIGRTAPDHRRFHTLVDRINPRIRRDPHWPQLASRLADVARTDVDLRQLLTDAADDGPLPDQMPGAALWWRLAGRLQPATLETSTPYLQPAWLADLHRVFGTATAETIAADPAFGRLVAAIENAELAHWTPLDLLHLADEHLRDLDHEHPTPLRPDEYARLLTYSIDLFTAAHPYDHLELPELRDADIPFDAEEEEALLHRVPDPDSPTTPMPDDVLLEMLGLGDGGQLVPPPLDDEFPPESADYGADDLALHFEDLLTERPTPKPLDAVIADVTALRAAHHRATEELRELQSRIHNDDGPAVRAAAEHLRDLRARADADRPYALAVQDVLARWADADADYEQAAHYLRYTQDQLTLAEADPDNDPLDIQSARAAVKLATLALPDTPPAQRFHRELADVMTERAEAAGGSDRIVTDDRVEAARKQAIADDTAAVAEARAHRDRVATDLDHAEIATAKAFAESETRTADYVLDHIDELHTELAMLRAAGDYRVERAIHIDPDAVSHLPDLAARGITNLARSGFTVNAVHAGDRETAREALAILRTAAIDQGRTIVWCSATDEQSAVPTEEGDVNVLGLVEAYQRFARRDYQIDATTTIFVDRAAQADPTILTDLSELAAEHHARLVLLYSCEPDWPFAPSARLLLLLQRDLPWSTTLSVKDATPERRALQPGLAPLLDQAARCDSDLIPSEVSLASAERARLNRQHAASSRVDGAIWHAGRTDAGSIAGEIGL